MEHDRRTWLNEAIDEGSLTEKERLKELTDNSMTEENMTMENQTLWAQLPSALRLSFDSRTHFCKLGDNFSRIPITDLAL